jgi:hypothetical protein
VVEPFVVHVGGTDLTTTPEFGHEDERTWQAFVMLMFAAAACRNAR